MEDKNSKATDEKNVVNVAIAGASAERVQRYGSAVKEHIVAYSGIDNENGTEFKKSLKKIAESKVNPDYKAQNLKQQAGFSAEVKEAANANAENIIKGSKNRKVRTDDLGKVNDPVFDFLEIDGNGNVIPGSGTQMKFVGSSPKEALNKLTSTKFSKYLDNNAKIEVPSDYYDGIMEEANKSIEKLQKQIENQRNSGNMERVEQLEKRLNEMEEVISKYLTANMTVFHEAFYEMKASLNIGDVDGFISGANAISRQLGRTPQFSDFEEFEQLMGNDSVIRI